MIRINDDPGANPQRMAGTICDDAIMNYNPVSTEQQGIELRVKEVYGFQLCKQ